jgi:hypothetical protein
MLGHRTIDLKAARPGDHRATRIGNIVPIGVDGLPRPPAERHHEVIADGHGGRGAFLAPVESGVTGLK